MEFFELINKRYSVRAYQAKPVEQEKLTKVLEAASLAPTAANRQPFRIIVIQPRGKEALCHRKWRQENTHAPGQLRGSGQGIHPARQTCKTGSFYYPGWSEHGSQCGFLMQTRFSPQPDFAGPHQRRAPHSDSKAGWCAVLRRNHQG